MARPPGFDRREVLEAAERQFRKTGYVGTSLDDITAATGLGRGSLYAAFGDKHALFLSALTDYCDRSEAAVAESLRGPDDGALARLRGYLAEALSLVFGDEDHLGCMAGRFAVELADDQDPDAAARIRQDFDAMRGALADCVQAAQRHGDVAPGADPRELATLFLVFARGIDVLARTGSDQRELRAVADRIFDCLPLTGQGADAARRLRAPAP
jgi:TetR/AcrR family transcriptional regulator, transcriptional repressor for nem operon